MKLKRIAVFKRAGEEGIELTVKSMPEKSNKVLSLLQIRQTKPTVISLDAIFVLNCSTEHTVAANDNLI